MQKLWTKYLHLWSLKRKSVSMTWQTAWGSWSSKMNLTFPPQKKLLSRQRQTQLHPCQKSWMFPPQLQHQPHLQPKPLTHHHLQPLIRLQPIQLTCQLRRRQRQVFPPFMLWNLWRQQRGKALSPHWCQSHLPKHQQSQRLQSAKGLFLLNRSPRLETKCHHHHSRLSSAVPNQKVHPRGHQVSAGKRALTSQPEERGRSLTRSRSHSRKPQDNNASGPIRPHFLQQGYTTSKGCAQQEANGNAGGGS